MTRRQREAVLARSPIGTTRRYRGAVLTRAWGGHVNVTRADGGFVGGWPSFAAARRAIDAMLGR